MLVRRLRGRRGGWKSSALTVFVLAGVAGGARSQQHPISFSIDWQGPSVGQLASTPPIPLTEADILLPAGGQPAFGPAPRPQILWTGNQLGVNRYGQCLGHPGGTPCGIEVDAFSYGNDARFRTTSFATHVYFSVEEHAVGHPGSILVPSVRSESATGVRDVSADVFVSLDLPAGPMPPGAAAPENVGTIDGNGMISGSGSKYRGVGLVEPNPPGNPPDLGDNLDGLDLGALPGPNGRVYFSLDACFTGPPGFPNSCSAQFQGVPPGSVLRKDLAGGLTMFAPATLLGLDLGGVGTDDLDALVLWENGNGVYDPAQAPYDWVDGSCDMLLFSVRRGSLVVGQPDSIFGIPIMPGDLLIAPFTGPGAAPAPLAPGSSSPRRTSACRRRAPAARRWTSSTPPRRPTSPSTTATRTASRTRSTSPRGRRPTRTATASPTSARSSSASTATAAPAPVRAGTTTPARVARTRPASAACSLPRGRRASRRTTWS
jgi:hypothetical protein